MNFLTTKHRSSSVKSARAKGEPLGRIGIFIALGFVGLVLATTLIGASASESVNVLQIDGHTNRLSASIANADAPSVAWSWYRVDDFDFIDGQSLGNLCQQIDESDYGVINEGLGAEVILDDSSLDSLYCFMATTETETVIGYAGHVVTSADLN